MKSAADRRVATAHARGGWALRRRYYAVLTRRSKSSLLHMVPFCMQRLYKIYSKIHQHDQNLPNVCLNVLLDVTKAVGGIPRTDRPFDTNSKTGSPFEEPTKMRGDRSGTDAPGDYSESADSAR
ncbi:hypothetical protein EVAR_93061_1 [Eumeta japonica]|uniref:Uncharacterized protein n=1 Tax=Eumeta variegata TaxID=151549 RepID=A0A4C1TIG2_EUMVA|nr:hypothetical protein EVAR_93061_1 [Eumeta japonica]